MKKSILFLSAIVVVAVMCGSCSFSLSSNQNDLQKQVEQLQQEVAVLQKMNGLTPSYEINDDTVVSSKPSGSKKSNGDEQQQAVKIPKEQTAVEAIKYCLKMYVPDLKYTNMRSAPQSDGTVDVIIDYKEKYTGSTEHTYYNVTVYSDKEFTVNSIYGLEGNFPHNSKMMIQ